MTTTNSALYYTLLDTNLQGSMASVFEDMSDTECDTVASDCFALIRAVMAKQSTTNLFASRIFTIIGQYMVTNYADAYDVDQPKQSTDGWNLARPIVKAMVIDGWLDYTPATTNTNGDDVIPASYTVVDGKFMGNKASLCKPVGESVVQMRYITEGTKHHLGAIAMSKHVFIVNVSRLKIVREMLMQNKIINRDAEWVPAISQEDIAQYDTQYAIYKSLVAAYNGNKDGFSFDVMADFRGRLYYVAGLMSPQSGGIAKLCLSHDDEIKLDATASFAQHISILTGDISLGRACNLTNFTDTPNDFYGSVYALAAGCPVPEKSSPIRKLAKMYLMPKAYGAGDDASISRLMEELASINATRTEPVSLEVANEVVSHLASYDRLDRVKELASALASALATRGIQLSWTTPAGNTVTQNYWESLEGKYKTHDKTNQYMPNVICYKQKTDRVAVGDYTGTQTKVLPDAKKLPKVKNATVSAAANMIQSLDAAFLAEVLADWYDLGHTAVAVHDSFSIKASLRAEFVKCAWTVMCRQANSPAMAELRKLIGISPKDSSWLNPNRIPCFITEE